MNSVSLAVDFERGKNIYKGVWESCLSSRVYIQINPQLWAQLSEIWIQGWKYSEGSVDNNASSKMPDYKYSNLSYYNLYK